MKTFGTDSRGRNYVMYHARHDNVFDMKQTMFVIDVDHNSLWIFNDVATAFRFTQHTPRTYVVSFLQAYAFIGGYLNLHNCGFNDCRYEKQITKEKETL